MILSVHHWILYNYNPFATNIVILVLSLYTLEFLPYSSKHCNTYLILSLQTWKFWPHPSKHWNSGPILINEVVVIFSLQTLEFWPNFYTLWLSYLILQNIEILALFLRALELWSYLGNVGILILPLQIILLFYPYFYRHRNSDLILPNIGIQNSIIVILAFFFQTLEFLSHSFTANIEILAPSFEKCEFWFVVF